MNLSADRIRRLLQKRAIVRKRTRHSQRGRQDPDYKAIKQADLETLELAAQEGHIDLKYLDESGCYVAQLYASRFWLSLLTKNLLKAVVFDIEASTKYMDAITVGWLMAKQAKPLFGIGWNSLWQTPLADLRTRLNIVQPNIFTVV